MKNATIILVIGILGALALSFLISKKDGQLGATLEQKIDAVLSTLSTQEASALQANGKYQQILKTIAANGIEYEVHEYVTAKGEKGYQVLIYNADGSVKSVGYGVESASRTWTFTPVQGTPSTTP